MVSGLGNAAPVQLEGGKGDDLTAIRIDARLLNRHEGYEVLLMIHKVVDRFDYESENDVRKLET